MRPGRPSGGPQLCDPASRPVCLLRGSILRTRRLSKHSKFVPRVRTRSSGFCKRFEARRLAAIPLIGKRGLSFWCCHISAGVSEAHEPRCDRRYEEQHATRRALRPEPAHLAGVSTPKLALSSPTFHQVGSVPMTSPKSVEPLPVSGSGRETDASRDSLGSDHPAVSRRGSFGSSDPETAAAGERCD